MPLPDFQPEARHARNWPRQVPAVRAPPPARRDAPDDTKEELDTVPDMPLLDNGGRPGQQPFARKYNSGIGNSMAHHTSMTRVAGSLQQTMRRMNDSDKGKGFVAERKNVMRQLTSQRGKGSGRLLVSARVFEDAVIQEIGSTTIAQRLFESQNPEGADEVPAERLVDAVLALEHAPLAEHLRITFELLDTRGDGSITTENLQDILKVAFVKLKIPVTDRQLRRVAEALMRDLRAQHSTPKPGPAARVPHAEGGAKGGLKLGGAAGNDRLEVVESVRFEDLLRLLQKYIDEVEQEKKARPASIMATSGLRARRLLQQIAGIEHLPFWLLFWVGLGLAFMAGYLQHYKEPLAHVSGAAFPLAKAFAQVIQPLAFLLLFAVCRRSITALRNTPLRYVLPFDESISFHRLCGYLMFICALGHSVCHIGNYVVWASGGSGKNSWDLTFTTPPPSASSLWGSETSITGYIMWFAILMGYPFAVYFPRMLKRVQKTALGRFLNNFTYFSVTHIAMWLIFYVALILHPYPGTPSEHKNHHNTTWIYVLLPMVLYIAERGWRLLRNVAFHGELLDVELLPGGRGGGVTVLRMKRPRDFSYRPGMYMFVSVPAISRMEWHPFTITSAPGDPYVSVHIRDAGDWTNALYKYMTSYVKEVEANLALWPEAEKGGLEGPEDAPGGPLGGISLARAVFMTHVGRNGGKPRDGGNAGALPQLPTFAPGAAHGLEPALHRNRTRKSLQACDWEPLPSAPLVLIDGPYSAPAMRWEDYEVVVLVGAGIGVTPFASVLADMVNKLEGAVCRNCGEVQENAGAGIKVQKIYFHWVVPDSLAPNYFASTLETISNDDQLGLIDPRIHLTAVKPDEKNGPDLHNVFVKLGQEALHRQRGVDVVIGLKSKVVTTFGRPDWPQVISGVASNHPGQTVGVFVCGPPPFTKSIKSACQNHNAAASAGIKVLKKEDPDLEAGQHITASDKTVFVFFEEYF